MQKQVLETNVSSKKCEQYESLFGVGITLYCHLNTDVSTMQCLSFQALSYNTAYTDLSNRNTLSWVSHSNCLLQQTYYSFWTCKIHTIKFRLAVKIFVFYGVQSFKNRFKNCVCALAHARTHTHIYMIVYALCWSVINHSNISLCYITILHHS